MKKGLRPPVREGVHVGGDSETSPDEEGIKTSRGVRSSGRRGIRRQALMKKGLRLSSMTIPFPSLIRRQALMKKGLRPRPVRARGAARGIRRQALMKKGLRLGNLPTGRWCFDSETSPDEEGIKTDRTPSPFSHPYSETSPDEEGIKTDPKRHYVAKEGFGDKP